ncbi:GNAT family N-acetyltransferase [Dyadobacter sp. CY345]|uniref:GNAT family N-acetyltransferase n=1 Tax=Dyadobacter sp. CY345 TaxID=2909335 RepID=UPI001F29EF6D|nr:GNAT family N-acetyltransferase [Dyadobacter sp. CY345]MCF2446124.1 GNAT family N-acetyltransferase [Dyadobacter sp. CY345]
MKIRTATEKDIPQLQKLGLNAYGQFETVLTNDNWIKLHSILLSEKTYPELLSKSTCFVWEENNEIIGMAFFISKGNPTDIFHEDWSYLRMVGVNTEHTGKGIGRKLMQLCIDHARQTGEKFIALHTSEFMNAARHIYESMGFVQIKELEMRLGKMYWLYVKEL